MKIVLPVDGSEFTKKALAFLVTHENLCGPDVELVVLNVQTPLPPRVKTMVGAAAVKDYHQEEASKVLKPIERFLDKHKLNYRSSWTVGSAAQEVIRTVEREHAHMIIMGTHGHGLLGRAVMGSVAQRVLADAHVPVLLVR